MAGSCGAWGLQGGGGLESSHKLIKVSGEDGSVATWTLTLVKLKKSSFTAP